MPGVISMNEFPTWGVRNMDVPAGIIMVCMAGIILQA
jgi:hypothetical protein